METLSPGQRRTAAAREAFAASFPNPQAKSDHYRALAQKANHGRVVLSGDEASALQAAYELLAKIAARTGLAEAEPTAQDGRSDERDS